MKATLVSMWGGMVIKRGSGLHLAKNSVESYNIICNFVRFNKSLFTPRNA